MITYEKYAEIRDSRGLTDGKIAEIAGFGRSTFSDWKSGRSTPKYEKMKKIAEALDMDYFEFIGVSFPGAPVGQDVIDKMTSYLRREEDKKKRSAQSDLINSLNSDELKQALEMYKLYQNSIPEIQSAVESLLKSHQSDS